MKSTGTRLAAALSLVALVTSALPVQALCWGSLYVMSSSTRMINRCPAPTLIKKWRIRCYDGCGYTEGTFLESLAGYGDCFREPSCNEGITCLPLNGADIYGFNPPTLTSSAVNRRGYYSSRPCGLPRCRTDGISTLQVVCPCDPDANPIFCAENDPLVISLRDARYRLTDRAGGVAFDLADTGSPQQVPWTHPHSDEAFLALDRNDNGKIDSGRELFGDVTPQHPTDHPNGFLALALFDDTLSGGNEDGRISAADAVFDRLRLWHDANHDGESDAGELLPLVEAGLEWIALDYEASDRVDQHGNSFRFRARSGWTEGPRRTIWNVFLIAD